MNKEVVQYFFEIAKAQGEELKKVQNANLALTEFLRGMLEAEKNNQQKENYVFQNKLLEDITTKNITLRSDGRYMGRKQIDGQIITVYSRSKRQCLLNLKRAIKNKDKATKPQIYLHNWLNEWFNNYKKNFVAYQTAMIILRTLEEIKRGIGNINIENLTTQKIQNFLNTYNPSRKKENISLYLNSALQKAEDIDIIKKNPFKAVVKDKRVNNIRNGYSFMEQKQILTAIKGKDIEPVILFYLCTGIRKNEINAFNINTDIDEENNLIKIKSEKKRNTKNLYRYIDVTPKLIELIKNNRKAFSLKTDYVYRNLKILLEELNIKTGLHRLRHTFATNHFYLGTPIKIISSWLGHETVELTQNIYTHIDRTINKNDILKLYNNLYYINLTQF